MQTQRDIPTGPTFGLFCAIAAIAIAAQTFYAYRNGYMYQGLNERVYKKDNPKKFKLWFGIQTSFVLFLAAMAVYGFLTY